MRSSAFPTPRTPAAVRTQRGAARGLGIRLFFGLVVLSFSACAKSAPQSPPEQSDRPNVLLITIDTLRADHLGAYGYDLPITPEMDRLASSGTVVERCVATATETAPTTASLLTGLYQHGHFVERNRAVLPGDVATLAERFKAAGYTTAGFVGNLLVTKPFGFSQGFDHFVEFHVVDSFEPSDPAGAYRFSQWLRRAPAQPWFAWIHFMDPHGAYVSARPGWSNDLEYPDGRFGEDRPVPLSESNYGLGVIPRYQGLPDQDRLSYYVRRYDGEIRLTDSQVGAVLADVDRAFGLGNTLTILTADHGESLTEHDEYLQHGWHLYDTTLRVPLLFSWPGVVPSGKRMPGTVSGVDLAPTILELVGVDHPAEEFHGRSYAAALLATKETEPTVYFARGTQANVVTAAIDGDLKLIRHPAGRPTRPDQPAAEARAMEERLELYDLREDPGELRNLAAQRSADTERLRAQLTEFDSKLFQAKIQRAKRDKTAK